MTLTGALSAVPGPLGAVATAATVASTAILAVFEYLDAEAEARRRAIERSKFSGLYAIDRAQDMSYSAQLAASGTPEEVEKASAERDANARYFLRLADELGALGVEPGTEGRGAKISVDKKVLARALRTDQSLNDAQRGTIFSSIEQAVGFANTDQDISQPGVGTRRLAGELVPEAGIPKIKVEVEVGVIDGNVVANVKKDRQRRRKGK